MGNKRCLFAVYQFLTFVCLIRVSGSLAMSHTYRETCLLSKLISSIYDFCKKIFHRKSLKNFETKGYTVIWKNCGNSDSSCRQAGRQACVYDIFSALTMQWHFNLGIDTYRTSHWIGNKFETSINLGPDSYPRTLATWPTSAASKYNVEIENRK